MSYAIHTELVYIYNLIAVRLFLDKNKKIIFPSFCFWLFAAYNYESIIAHTCFYKPGCTMGGPDVLPYTQLPVVKALKNPVPPSVPSWCTRFWYPGHLHPDLQMLSLQNTWSFSNSDSEQDNPADFPHNGIHSVCNLPPLSH